MHHEHVHTVSFSPETFRPPTDLVQQACYATAYVYFNLSSLMCGFWLMMSGGFLV